MNLKGSALNILTGSLRQRRAYLMRFVDLSNELSSISHHRKKPRSLRRTSLVEIPPEDEKKSLNLQTAMGNREVEGTTQWQTPNTLMENEGWSRRRNQESRAESRAVINHL